MLLPSSWTRQIIPGTLTRDTVRVSLWSVAAQSRPQLPSLSSTLPQAGQLTRMMIQPPAPFLSAEINQARSLRSRLSSQSLLLRCLFRRWGCGHNDSGHGFGGPRSCALLQMGCWNSLDAHLCSLTLLLKLLQLLGSEEAHRLIASNELSTCWHGCEDDVAA